LAGSLARVTSAGLHILDPTIPRPKGQAGCEMYCNKRDDRHQDAPRRETRALQWDDNRKVELNLPKVRPRSLIESSVTMTGDLWSEGDLEIDGHLCGNINCQQLIVGKNAAVTGVIVAQEAVIRGKRNLLPVPFRGRGRELRGRRTSQTEPLRRGNGAVTDGRTAREGGAARGSLRQRRSRQDPADAHGSCGG
jgi:hypothetical protein